MKDKNFGTIIEKYFKKTVIGLGIVIFAFFNYYSLRFTVFFGMDYKRVPHYSGDSLVMNLISLVTVLGITGLLVFYLSKIKNQKVFQSILLSVVFLWILIFELWWIKISQTVPGADQRYVWVGAQEFMQGNYRYLEAGKYFQFYPHQLPLVMFCQFFMKVFHTTESVAFKYFNAICSIVSIFFLWKIYCEFSSKNTEKISFILASACIFPLYLYTTFIYSEIVSLTWMLIAVYFLLKFVKTDRWYFAAGCFAFITLAVMCRKNMLIAVIAILLLIAISFMKKKRWSYVLLAVLIVASTTRIGSFSVDYFENQTKMEINEGVGSLSFIAMGMQEGSLAEGWFNKFTEESYREAGFDRERSNEIALQAIRDRITKFKEEPGYFLDFYKNKILKQWNEPTYGGFINNSYHDERALPEEANSMYYGELHTFFVKFCNIYQEVIFIGVLLYLIICFSGNTSLEQNILFVVFLGGFFFHILWEADSRYAMPYFVMLIPYGIWGINMAISKFSLLWGKTEHGKSKRVE